MLEIKNLTGGYVHVPVLKDVSFTVESGQLVGLIGLNGAGKSTTINEIIGLLTPYSGEISIDGLTLGANPREYRQQIGYIPETPSLYEELTLREHIETVAMAYGIEQNLAFERVEPLLKMFRLDQKLDRSFIVDDVMQKLVAYFDKDNLDFFSTETGGKQPELELRQIGVVYRHSIKDLPTMELNSSETVWSAEKV